MKHSIPIRVPIRTIPLDAIRWCEQQFGTRLRDVENTDAVWCYSWEWTDNWEGPDRFDYYNFHFQNDQDAVLFTLMWGKYL